jgi:hypothetical protein
LAINNIATFDKILKHENADENVIANNYLHIINAHPELLSHYNKTKQEKILLFFKYILSFLVRIFNSIFKLNYSTLTDQKKRVDILFLSHLTNPNQLSHDNDAYFGDLPHKLLENNLKSGICLIDHIKYKKKIKVFPNQKIQKFILGLNLNFASEIKLHIEQFKSKKKLKTILISLKVDNTLKKEILRSHLSASTINSMRIAWQVADIINKTGASSIISTYEGFAWERLVFFYARKVNPKIQCFGYQHSAFFEHQHSAIRQLTKQYDPDVILTSGKISQRLYEKSLIKGIDFLSIGSPKYIPANKIIDRIDNFCLVIPEGFISECLILFEFCLNYAKKYHKQKFIWRLHPLINFDKLKSQSSSFFNLPSNILLSNKSLEEDISKCNSVIYRGSTAVFNAINSGLKPIYFKLPDEELSIDPIFECTDGKFIVENETEFSNALCNNNSLRTKQNLQKFAQKFYTPLNSNPLLKRLIEFD